MMITRLARQLPKSRLITRMSSSVASTPLACVSRAQPLVSGRGGLVSSPICREIATSRVTFDKASLDFKLADIGEGIAECEVIQWFVKEGDHVAQFDKICEVQSDKATVEITSRYDGKITKLFYGKGDMAQVGHALVSLEVDASSVDPTESSPDPEKAAETPETKSETQKQAAHVISPSTGRVLCSPAVRHMARINSINLPDVQGTGPKGRITKEDVLRVIETGVFTSPDSTSSSTSATTTSNVSTPSTASFPSFSPPTPSATTNQAPTPAAPVYVNKFSYSGMDQKVAIQGLERIMVKTMQSSNEVPQFGYCDEIKVGKLNELRRQLKPIAAMHGCGLSNLPMLIKAASMALLQFPQLNAHVNKTCCEVTHKASHNIGIAVDTPRGLLVPNIKDCQNKSILDIALEVARLAKLGREAKLGTDDLTGGTFTLSNVGSIGGTYASPLVVVPEVCIGALGKFQKLPRFNSNGDVIAEEIMNVSWSADHRVIDGATVARFSNTWKGYIEDPSLMLLYTK